MQIKTVIIFLVITIGVLLGVGGLLYQFGEGANKPIVDVAGDKRHAIGNGEIVVTEFSDFQCPACQSVQQPLKQMLKKYEGKVTFVYRHFPLNSIHKNAQIAAQAAEAASVQGKFFELHDKLFETQRDWESAPDPKEKFAEYGAMIGIDRDKFLVDIDSQVVKNYVNTDSLAATRYRLTGTPTFFVNGVKVEFGQLDSKLTELTKESN